MKKRRITIIVLTIILIVNFFVSYSFYTTSLYKQVIKNAKDRLNEMASFGYYLFNNKLEEQINNVKNAANLLEVSDNFTEEKTLEILVSTTNENQLLRSAYSSADGNYLTSDNLRGNVSNEEFFQTAMRGEFHITNPTPAVVEKTKKVLLLTSPVYKNDVVVGTLTFSYLCDELEDIFNLTLVNENAHTVITNENGDVLIGDIDGTGKHKNLFSYIKKMEKKQSKAAFSKNVGTLKIETKESQESFLAKYNRLTTKEWYAITIVKEKYTMSTLDTMTTLRQDWNIYLLCSVLIYILFIGLMIREHVRNVDKLTRLMTINAFKKKAAKILTDCPEQAYIIIKLDIRNFKLINRIYGFDTGNNVIKNMASALKEVSKSDNYLLARLSIDNFILMLPYHNKGDILKLRDQFIINFRRLMGAEFIDNVDFPTGQYIAFIENRENDRIDDIYEKVNFAHQIAKQSDLNLIVDYDEALEKNAIYQKDLEDRMQLALKNEEFRLFIQPKYCLKQNCVCSGEALIRWIEKDGSILSPNEFIPLFEKNGFIVSLDKFMFEQVVKMLRNLMDEQKEVYPISVNFSRLHLNNENLVQELCEIADKYRVPHHLLEIELTESIVFDNIEIIIFLIDQLHENGFTISIDDFGAGYSSLSLLKDVKVDVVKLDKSFFSTIRREKRSDVVISNILRMTRELGIKTVAEGIETQDYVDFLRESDCDMIQGYYYSKPISQDEYEEKYFKSLQ